MERGEGEFLECCGKNFQSVVAGGVLSEAAPERETEESSRALSLGRL